ncbi:hypothetical protein ACETK8_10555 [Brevundimonas staleyi]|uniref:DUF2946 domain-containing protein n=2 Tax=Brevundimonas TaxID=41275 RepID=A0ABW0FSK6_9CAUL
MTALFASFLTLFVLVSTVEAATCASETMTRASETIAEAPSDSDDAGRSDQQAICSHCLCCHHIGAVAIDEPELGLASTASRRHRRMPPVDFLVSSAPTGLDRPPQG